MKIRNVNAGRYTYELEDDAYEGLDEALRTNRPLLAMEYISKILKDHQELLTLLKKAHESESVTKARKPAAPSKEDDAKEV